MTRNARPLTDGERELADEAFRLTRAAMRGYRARYPQFADDIDGEFDWRVCRRIRDFDPGEMELRTWVFATLRYAVRQAIRTATEGRNEDFRQGKRAFVPLDEACDESAVSDPQPIGEYMTDATPEAHRIAVEMHLDGFGSRAIGAKFGCCHHTARKWIREGLAAIRASIEVNG